MLYLGRVFFLSILWYSWGTHKKIGYKQDMKEKKIKHPHILLATLLKPNVEIWWFQSKVIFFKIWQLQPTKSLLAFTISLEKKFTAWVIWTWKSQKPYPIRWDLFSQLVNWMQQRTSCLDHHPLILQIGIPVHTGFMENSSPNNWLIHQHLHQPHAQQQFLVGDKLVVSMLTLK